MIGPIVQGGGPGVDLVYPGYVSGRWYPSFAIVNVAAGTQAADTLYAFPVQIFRPVTIAALGVRCDTGVAATSLIAGIYANDASTGRPAAKLGELSAALSGVTSTTSVSSALVANVALPPSVVWLACIVNGLTQFRAISQANTIMAALNGGSSVANAGTGAVAVALSKAQTYAGGLPSTLAGSAWTDVVTAVAPNLVFQVA